MDKGYRVKGTRRTRIHEADVLRIAARAGHAGATITWAEDEGHAVGAVVKDGQVVIATTGPMQMRGADREEVLLAMVALFAHDAADCQCRVQQIGPCPAALRAAYELGFGPMN